MNLNAPSIFSALNITYNDFGNDIGIDLTGSLKQSRNISREAEHLLMMVEWDNKVSRYYFTGSNESRRFNLKLPTNHSKSQLNLSLDFSGNFEKELSFNLFIDEFTFDTTIGAISAGVILLCLNILIVSEVNWDFCYNHFYAYQNVIKSKLKY